jgi:hypothetical protein
LLSSAKTDPVEKKNIRMKRTTSVIFDCNE